MKFAEGTRPRALALRLRLHHNLMKRRRSMFRRMLFVGAGALILLGTLGSPGPLSAQKGAGKAKPGGFRPAGFPPAQIMPRPTTAKPGAKPRPRPDPGITMLPGTNGRDRDRWGRGNPGRDRWHHDWDRWHRWHSGRRDVNNTTNNN